MDAEKKAGNEWERLALIALGVGFGLAGAGVMMIVAAVLRLIGG